MQVTVVPIDDFIHDDLRFRKGKDAQLDDHVAYEFERRGLVRIVVPEMVFIPNVLDGGQAAQPSSLHLDRLSPLQHVIMFHL